MKAAPRERGATVQVRCSPSAPACAWHRCTLNSRKPRTKRTNTALSCRESCRARLPQAISSRTLTCRNKDRPNPQDASSYPAVFRTFQPGLHPFPLRAFGTDAFVLFEVFAQQRERFIEFHLFQHGNRHPPFFRPPRSRTGRGNPLRHPVNCGRSGVGAFPPASAGVPRAVPRQPSQTSAAPARTARRTCGGTRRPVLSSAFPASHSRLQRHATTQGNPRTSRPRPSFYPPRR